MNKNLIFTLVVTLFFLTAIPSAFSQNAKIESIEYVGQSTKFALMVNNARHYQSAVMTAQALQVKEKGYAFEIVVVGVLAKELAEDPSLLATLNMAEALGVKTVVCQSAMDFFGITKEDLDDRLEVTKNGWIYMFELKDKGFNALST